MQVTSTKFKSASQQAIADPTLQKALTNLHRGFVSKRAKVTAKLPEFDALRDQARDLKNHVLANLDTYLTQYEKSVHAAGGKVHWARDAEEARQIIADICQQQNARKVTKGKSMITEEIALNDHLEAQGIEVLETDLGEYILQLRNDHPSHIVAPAIHIVKEQVADSFREAHQDRDAQRDLSDIDDLLAEARSTLRHRFGQADVGITGANFLLADSGMAGIVTNEGNGDLTQMRAKTHVVVASLEKVLPDFDAAALIMRVLARSATGQEITAYTTFSGGPRRQDDVDGPEQYHVVLVDNGRTKMLADERREMLRCIRCGACMNHCPVYGAVGGQTYGWVYPGPMGAVLTPSLAGLNKTHLLPNASTFCGRCVEVCPVRIPLTKLMRNYREQAFEKRLDAPRARWALKLWAWTAKHPKVYHFGTRMAVKLLYGFGHKHGRFSRLPLATGWTAHRDFPAPEAQTFLQQWQAHEK